MLRHLLRFFFVLAALAMAGESRLQAQPDTWSTLHSPPFPFGVSAGGGLATDGRYIYAADLSGDGDSDYVDLNRNLVDDNSERFDAVGLPNGSVRFARYDPSTDTWVGMPTLNSAGVNGDCFSAGDLVNPLFVAAGRLYYYQFRPGPEREALYSYDVASGLGGSWTTVWDRSGVSPIAANAGIRGFDNRGVPVMIHHAGGGAYQIVRTDLIATGGRSTALTPEWPFLGEHFPRNGSFEYDSVNDRIFHMSGNQLLMWVHNNADYPGEKFLTSVPDGTHPIARFSRLSASIGDDLGWQSGSTLPSRGTSLWGNSLTMVNDPSHQARGPAGEDTGDNVLYLVRGETSSDGWPFNEGRGLITNGDFARYFPSTQTFQNLPRVPFNIGKGSCAVYLNGRIYVTQGDTLTVADDAGGSGPMPGEGVRDPGLGFAAFTIRSDTPPVRLELRIVPQDGVLPGSIADGTPGEIQAIQSTSSGAARTKRFEIQYRILDLNNTDTIVPAGLTAGLFNITGGAAGSFSSSMVARGLLSRFEAQLAGSSPPLAVDSSGNSTGALSGARGLHRPFRGGIGGSPPNNSNVANGTVNGLSINSVTPLTIASLGQGDVNLGLTGQEWYGLYTFEFTAGSSDSGVVTFVVEFIPDIATGNRFGYFNDGAAVPLNSAAAETASISVLVGSGACCLPGFTCAVVPTSTCTSQGGIPADVGTCTPLLCCPAPVISSQPQPANVDARQTAMLSISASHQGPLSYNWRRNGVALANDSRISGADGPSLTISPVSASDAGNYDVIVSTVCGRNLPSNSAALTVCDVPLITSQPIDRELSVGTTTVLGTSASSSAAISYQWRHDGVPLTDGPGISGSRTASLRLSPVVASSAGVYDAQLSIPCRTITTNAATLTVVGPNLTVDNLVAPTEATWGRSVTVEWDEHNTGNRDAAGTWRDRLILSANAVLGDSDDRTLANVNAGPLPAGQSAHRTAVVAVPPDLQRAGYVLFVICDVDNSVAELNEQDNTVGPSSSFPASAPDLRPGAVAAPSSGAFGQSLTLNWTDQNIGDRDATPSWEDMVVVSTSPVAGQGTERTLARVRSGPLNRGGALERSATVTLPTDLPVGNVYFFVRSDSASEVPELDESNNTSPSGSPLFLDAPDLAVASVIAPSSGVFGQPLVVSWTISNGGGINATGVWNDAAVLSVNDVFGDSDDIPLIPATPGPSSLAAHDTYTRSSVSLATPIRYLPAADYKVMIRTGDPLNRAPIESNALNNVGASGVVRMNPTPAPDLVVTQITAPDAAVSSSTITVGWTVRNAGNLAASGAWVDRVYLSSDQSLDTNDAPISPPLQRPNAQTPLGSNTTYSQQISLTLPVNYTNGTFYIIVKADDGASGGAATESDETNNTLARAISLSPTPAPDLVAVSATAPASAVFGQSISITWQGRNAGNVPASGVWGDRVYLSSDANLSPDDLALGTIPTTTTPLAPSQPYDGAATLTVPLTGSSFPSDYRIIVALDSFNSIAEANELNNAVASAPIHITLPPLPDLAASGMSPPSAAAVGQTVSVGFDIQNLGPAAVATPFGVRIALSSDAAIGSDLTVSEFLVSDPIPAQGGLIHLNRSFQVPDIGLEYRVVVCVDTLGRIVEEHEDNNCGIAGAPSPISRPDLQIASVSAPVSGVADGQLAVSWTVHNGGQADTLPGSFWIDRAYLSQDAALTSDKLVASVPHTGGLLANQDYTVNQTINVPSAARGTYRLYVVTDSTNSVFESGPDSNNTAAAGNATEITQPPRPNLVVESITLPPTGLVGSSSTVQWTVRNTGGADASALWVDQVVAVRDGQPPSQTVLGVFTRPNALSVGQPYTQAGQVTFPAVGGNYHIVVTTDSANTVNEGYDGGELDNSLASPDVFQVQAYDVTVSTSFDAGAAGTPSTLSIPLIGTATFAGTSDPVPNASIGVGILVRSTKRIVPATTRADGSFDAVFNPIPTEAGSYRLSAGPVIAVPEVAQDTFMLFGMRPTPASIDAHIMPGAAASMVDFSLINSGDNSIMGLQAEVSGDTSGLTTGVDFGAATLAPLETRTVHLSVAADSSQSGARSLVVHLTSTQGASADVQVNLTVAPGGPHLVAVPTTLASDMLRSTAAEVRQTNVQFTVTNDGASPTPPLEVRLPGNTPWMTLASPSPIAPLAPGASTAVVLTLSPAPTLTTGLYSNFVQVVGQGGVQPFVNVPFNFRCTDDGMGDLRIFVEDEFTYFDQDHGYPLVAGATVTITDPETNNVVATGVTGSDGLFVAPHLRNILYNVETRAPQHLSDRRLLQVINAESRDVRIFLPRQLVTYTWVVTPTDVPDHYEFNLRVTFETSVPAPVVTVEPAHIDLSSFTLPVTQVDLIIENHGLIRADNVRLNMSGNAAWQITPLLSSLGNMLPNQRVSVPVIFSRLRGSDDACSIKGELRYGYQCGGLQERVCPISCSDPGICPGQTGNYGGGGGGSDAPVDGPGSAASPTGEIPIPCCTPVLRAIADVFEPCNMAPAQKRFKNPIIQARNGTSIQANHLLNVSTTLDGAAHVALDVAGLQPGCPGRWDVVSLQSGEVVAEGELQPMSGQEIVFVPGSEYKQLYRVRIGVDRNGTGHLETDEVSSNRFFVRAVSEDEIATARNRVDQELDVASSLLEQDATAASSILNLFLNRGREFPGVESPSTVGTGQVYPGTVEYTNLQMNIGPTFDGDCGATLESFAFSSVTVTAASFGHGLAQTDGATPMPFLHPQDGAPTQDAILLATLRQNYVAIRNLYLQNLPIHGRAVHDFVLEDVAGPFGTGPTWWSPRSLGTVGQDLLFVAVGAARFKNGFASVVLERTSETSLDIVKVSVAGQVFDVWDFDPSLADFSSSSFGRGTDEGLPLQIDSGPGLDCAPFILEINVGYTWYRDGIDDGGRSVDPEHRWPDLYQYFRHN